MHVTVYKTSAPAPPQDAESDQLQSLLGEPDTLVWVDMVGPSDDEVRILRDVFHFHPLAIEDTQNQRQRPKVEQYDDYLFAILNPITLNETGVDIRELDTFAGRNFVVTVHGQDEPVIVQVRRRMKDATRGHSAGAGWLLYALADEVVDSYFPILDEMGDRIEAMGDRILTDPRPEMLEELFRLKRCLTEIWRVVGQQRDSFGMLTRDMPIDLFSEALMPYLRDVYDHLLRISDTINTFRDSASNVLDVYMSAISNRLNVQVNRLTFVTIGIGLVTVIVGFYGMNFTRTWPGFDSPWGVPFALALIVATAVGVVVLLRHMDRL